MLDLGPRPKYDHISDTMREYNIITTCVTFIMLKLVGDHVYIGNLVNWYEMI